MPNRIFSLTGDHFLRNTTLFGVYRRYPEPNGAPSGPRIMPDDPIFSELRNPYCPDILNDLQLTDHYPMVQEVKMGDRQISVLSLNCMRQCQRLPEFYNNGFEKEETPREYAERLDLLVKLVITLIQENPAITFSLQEAPDYRTAIGKKFFDEILKQTGWKHVEDYTSCQQVGLVTLYNPAILALGDCNPSSRGSRFQIIFFSVNDNSITPFRLINMHGQLNDSKRYGDLISEVTKDSLANTIITGDTNIPASEHAIQALESTNSADKLEQHHQVIEGLNQSGIHGVWTVVKGTIDESKNGVDTLDIIACSPAFCTEKSRELTTIPELDPELIARSRLTNRRLTQGIRDDLTNTIKLFSQITEELALEVTKYTGTLYGGRRCTDESIKVKQEFFMENFGATISTLSNPSLSHLRVVAFSTKNEASLFSVWLTDNHNIPKKNPQPYGHDGSYSILLTDLLLSEIQSKYNLAELDDNESDTITPYSAL